MKNFLSQFTIFLALFVLTSAEAQVYYHFPVTNFTPKNYGVLQNPQNWCVTESREGLIYVGNDNGVMEYDGTKWNFLPVILGQRVFSLAVDSSNILFAGTTGQFGYFHRSAIGKPEYVSLSDSLLKADDKYFSNVWRIYATKEKVFFQAYEAIFVYDYKTIKVIYPESTFHLLMYADGEIYARERQKGLVKITVDKTEVIDKSETTATYGIFALLSDESNRNRLMMVTQELGLFWLNKKGGLTDINSPDEDFLVKSKIYGGIKLPGNLFALNTELSGTIVVDVKGKIRYILNDQTGLQNNYVIAQYFDKTGNLWLALNKGLSKADWYSPLQVFDESAGLHGTIHDAVFFRDKIYVASSDGLFIKDDNAPRFERDNTIHHLVKKILEYKNTLLIASDDGLFQLENNNIKKVFSGNITTIEYSPAMKKMIVGTQNGVFLLNEQLKEELYIQDIEGEVYKITEGKTAKDKIENIWVSTLNGNTYVFNARQPVLKMNSFSVDNGLPKDWIYPFNYNGKVYFGSNYGLFELKGESFDTVGIFDQVELFGKKYDQPFSYFIENKKGNYYYAIDNKIHFYDIKRQQDSYTPFIPIELGKINSIHVSNDQVLISCNEGLAVYNENDKKNYNLNFNVTLRKIIAANDSVIFMGSLTGRFGFPKELSYSENKLSFEFSSTYLFREDANVYAIKLEGVDTAYSGWKKENTFALNNLAEGKYILWIKSKNIFNKESDPLSIEFRILPPWYRTTAAYFGYGLAFILILFLTAKAASYRVKKQKEILEDLVKQRTKEIEDKNVELEERNHQIMHQKQEITDSINYAKRIQTAILHPIDEIQRSMRDVFVLFIPKDIVSGDFYWYYKISEEEFLIACADCTGHGVPGGFMSMVCTDKLNEAVKSHHDPGEILKFANVAIKRSLRQDGKEGTTKDGMEISLLKVNTRTKHVIYSGANRFMWIVRHEKNEVEDIKPTKAGIAGSTEDSQHFETHHFQFKQNDVVYLSSDGFGDQFGGEKQKKLTTKRFKEILLKHRGEPMNNQHDSLKNFITNWRGGLEQVDDILVIGLKF